MNAQVNIIAGATASGKSALALKRAQKCGGVIINADALQLYTELQILSARPVEDEMEEVPHKLFGVLTHESQSSAGKWLEMAKAEIDAALMEDIPVFVVGGTGLYIKALLEGLSPIPEVPEEVVKRLSANNTNNNIPLHALLARRDPEIAAKLEPGDTQRIIRALAVLEHTGKSLAYWQQQPKQPPYPREMFHVTRIEIEREMLYSSCDTRFEAMLMDGALDEIRQLQTLDIPSSHTLMKAVGVPELMGYLQDKWSLEEAVTKAKQHTRNYAKRQLTWLRHQLAADEIVEIR